MAALPADVLWKARQLYEEKDALGRRLWSYRRIAAHLGISETSVLRACTNTGRFANVNNTPLPTPKSVEEMDVAAAASLEKLQKLLAAERDERIPGQTRADKLLAELSPETAARAKELLINEDTTGGKNGQAGNEAGKPVSPLDE